MTLDRPHFFGLLAGLFLAAGLVGAAMVVTRAWIFLHESAVISVTGSAARDVLSDLIVWKGNFQVEDATLAQAQDRWAADLARIETFLKAHSVTNYLLDSVTVTEVKSRPTKEDLQIKTVAYNLSQDIQFTSTNSDQVAAIGRDAISVVRQGVLFTSHAPEFIYTKAADAKISMLAEATRDAQVRAEKIAAQGRRALGDMRAARMGVFQITPRYSTETSSEGLNDTTTNEKTIRAVVSATFALK
jgi:hypothetical protein